MALLPSLPDAARVWIHPTATPLAEDTKTAVIDRLEAFVNEWRSHDRTVLGGVTILHDRFIVLAGAVEDGSTPSGCAIDDATRVVEETARELDIEWVSSLHVLYRTDEGTIEAVSRGTFQNRVNAGRITTETRVFDPSITTLGALRHGDFEQPAAESWHADAFSIAEPA